MRQECEALANFNIGLTDNGFFQVLLIVNVASECGYTDNHYRELVELQSHFPDDSFVILAFPCNQFGSQEPKRNSAIERFAKQTYAVQFPMFAKIKVIGENAHPIYKWLKTINGEEPNWNFCKYLLDNQGKVAKFESPNVSPLAMYNDIENLIFHGSLEGSTSQEAGKHSEL